MDDDNNLTVTVTQADGTSKSGSVALPGGGVRVVTVKVNSFTYELSIGAGSITASGSSVSSTVKKNRFRQSVSNLSGRTLLYSVDKGQFFDVDYNIDSGSESDITMEDDVASGYPYNAAVVSLSTINNWLQTLVGQQLVERTDKSVQLTGNVANLAIEVGELILSSVQNFKHLYLSTSPQVSVTFDEDGIITSVGTLTGSIYGLSAIMTNAGTTWNAQTITIKAGLCATGIEGIVISTL